MIRVLLVAAYASVRAGLHALLAGDADCVVVGQVSGVADLARVLPDLRPDVVVLDALPGEAGRVAALLAGVGAGLVLLDEGLAGGALRESDLPGWAWLPKEADAAEITGTVRAVAAGLIVVDAAFLPMLTRDARSRQDSAPGDEALTPRETEVLQLMARGLPNKQIAARLSVSLHTVKFHVASILAKLGAASRTEAVTLGVRKGIVLL